MIEFADKFEDLVQDQSKWSQETFGSDAERGPAGALKHLAKEATEAVEAIGTEHLEEELADCFLLILDAARRARVKPMALVEAAQRKMVVNRSRTWPTPVPDEPVEHIQ
jgi:NTP pyrophosphatase (non-canonical NTP hydrolase)